MFEVGPSSGWYCVTKGNILLFYFFPSFSADDLLIIYFFNQGLCLAYCKGANIYIFLIISSNVAFEEFTRRDKFQVA